MSFFKKFLVSVLTVSLLLSCGREQLDGNLVSVTVETQRVRMSDSGTATVSFTVDEPQYVFDLTRDVVLYNADGINPAPEDFSLLKVTPGEGSGQYVATLADRGLHGGVYLTRVLLGIQGRDGVITFSAPFEVCGEHYGFHTPTLETGLPVLYLDTENKAPILSKEDYVTARLAVHDSEEDSWVEDLSCQVRGRGNTTWWWPKKPYLVKLDKKASVLGMPKHKRWVLLANFMDRTLMRNLVSMRVASFTSLDWTPRCRSVELVLNGKHQGNYLLIEQVRVDKDRVPVTEMTPEDNDGEAVTGGYLLELDFHYDNEVQWIDPHGKSSDAVPGRGVPFGVKYPDPEDLTSAQLAYIKKYISDTATALYGSDFKDPEKGYARYIDVDSFVDYWIVFEVMGNHELGNPGSVYFHKDRGGKLVAGPCWDFDWGILSYNTSPHARTGLVNEHAIWYDRLFQDPAFRQKVKDRFQELLPKLETIPDFIRETELALEASAGLNFAMWNPAEDASMNGGQIINGDENQTFHQASVRLKGTFEERLNVIAKSL